MRNLRTGFVALLALAFLVDLAAAEPPDPKDGQPRDRQGGPGGPRRGRPGDRRGDRGPGRPFGPPPPLVIALDTDKDGVISAKEIENAAAALKTLDKNNDGKLTREELRPQFDGRGGSRGRRGFRGPGRPGDRQGDRGPGRPFGGEGFIERILGFDQNKDGKVSKDELPERMQRIFDRADTNKDGALDKDELKKMAERFRQRGRRGRPGEDGRGGRPGDGIPITAHAESTSESTQRIDDIVLRDLQKHKQIPNARVDDTQFVRRVYLDVIGRIPTASELVAFHASPDEDRRARLIDDLLASDGHISHMYNWLGDMLRVKDGYYRIGKTYTFQTWLKDQLRENRPWDEIVYELLTAEGRLGENGATAWLLRDASMPLDSLSNTLTTFLGANVSCAQCHDHPFAKWTQRDFYEMASFFGATAFERIDARKPAKKMADDRFSKANLVTLLRINIERVEYDKDRATLFPEDYAYDDASPGDKVTPKFIKWNDSEKTTSITAKPQHRRKQFANWMISPENPRFAAAIANRLWKMYFGVAVKEPVTDLDVLEDAINPELLKHLAQVMKDVDFDIRAFQRILLNTKTYQQQASLTQAEGKEYRFPGPLLRRMTAEQAWDSLVLMLRGPQIDRLQVDNAPKMTRLLFPDDIPLDNAGILREKEKIFAFAKSILDEREYSSAKTGGRNLFMRGPKYRGNSGWIRASELTQPMSPTHFLRLAGQSARDVADDGSVEGGITESLAFMNGEYTKSLMSNSASVMKTAGRIKSNEKKIVFLYETFLSRQPTVEELERVASALKDGLELKDVVWALVNSREFLFIQ